MKKIFNEDYTVNSGAVSLDISFTKGVESLIEEAVGLGYNVKEVSALLHEVVAAGIARATVFSRIGDE